MGATAEPAPEARAAARLRSTAAAVTVALLALLPAVGTLRAPWIAEDASLLAAAVSDGPWTDWFRSQGGLLLLRFWRPVVSTSWALQQALCGLDPACLRLLNLGSHAAAAVLAFACARRLGAGLPAASVAGAWVAWFPEQGGTSTWLAGRTDLLCAALLLASLTVALGARPILAAPLAFLACATKEFGFLAPLWCALFVLGRDGWSETWRRTWPALLGAALAFLWRRLALGSFAGGYDAALPGISSGVPGALGASAVSAWLSWAGLLAIVAVGLLSRGIDRRAVGFALAAAALALVPLYPLLADGSLEPENRRLLYVPECALGLACALALGRSRLGLAWLLVGAALAARGVCAALDTHAWARSAELGEERVAHARAAVARAERGTAPVLFRDFPLSHADAYCLGFGLAARFRAPFPASPRPVWPWRLVFVADAARAREPTCAARADGSLWPLDDPRRVHDLLVLDEDGVDVELVALDERVLAADADASPRLRLRSGAAGARLEALLVSELGYEPLALGALDERGEGTVTLRSLLDATNGVVTGGQVLQQAADLGALRAYLELRELDGGGGVEAASRWIELRWPRELLARSLGS